MMSSQHRYTNRNYRPDDDKEYEPAKATIGPAGYNMNQLVRAMLRWFNNDAKAALKTLGPYLKAVEDETPKGRPSRKDGES